MPKNSLAVLRSKKLPTYDDACKFLAAMVDIAPVKEIKDQAEGIKEYAIAAKDAALLEQAIRIRYEAWRTIGRIIRDMQKRGELISSKGGRPPKNTTHGGSVKTLRDLGFSANESHNAQWLLDLPKNEYERRVASIVKKMVGSLGAVFRQAMRDERKKALYAKTEIAPGLHVGDFRNLSPELIDDESVELVFIDPPRYAESAARVFWHNCVLCLYCCLDKLDIHRGFWAHDIPKLETLWIPPQRSIDLDHWYNRTLPPLFPGIGFANAPTRGSGDPFVIIHESVVITLPTWQELFEREWMRWTNNGNSAWANVDPDIWEDDEHTS